MTQYDNISTISKPRKIFIAIPSKDDAVRVATFKCVLGEMIEMLCRGWAPSIEGYGSLNPTYAARNRAVAEFIASDCDDLVFVDDDVVWEVGALCKLLDYPVDFVGGATPYKSEKGGFPVRVLDGHTELRADPQTGLIALEGIPFGLVRITRKCAEAMVKHYAALRYDSVQIPGGAWRLFSYELVDGQDRSEDFMFCKRWVDMGGTVWCDTNISFCHIGMKGYPGNFHEWLKAHPDFSKTYFPKAA